MVQRHTRCSTSYCLRKNSNESELKCRFHFPFDHSPQTKLEMRKLIARMTTCIIKQELLPDEMIQG